MEPFTAAYLSGATVLVVAELTAVFRRQSGDTITEKVKASRILHAAMSSLLVWGVWHFVGNDLTGHDGLATNIAIASAGAAAGVAAHSRR